MISQPNQYLPLFVYGSLRPGQCNYGQLSQAVRKVTPALFPGHLTLRPEGYPALILPEGWPQYPTQPYNWTLPNPPPPDKICTPNVPGEVLLLEDSPELRQRLDDFESFSLHQPEYCRVACAWNQIWVWTYVAPYATPPWPVIPSWPPDDSPIPPWR